MIARQETLEFKKKKKSKVILKTDVMNLITGCIVTKKLQIGLETISLSGKV